MRAAIQRLRGGFAARVLPWLVVALLLVLLVLRLGGSCGIGGLTWPILPSSWLPSGCAIADQPSDPGILAEIAALENQVRDQEADLTGRAIACSAAQAPSVPAPAPAVDPPIVADVERRLERVERGRSLEITLAWDGPSDLDLHVACPGGATISFQSSAACGARLVADLNNGGGSPDARPIEHITWGSTAAPDGTYRVGVMLFHRHGDTRPAIPFRVLLWQDGQIIRQESRQIDQVRQLVAVLEFSPLSSR